MRSNIARQSSPPRWQHWREQSVNKTVTQGPWKFSPCKARHKERGTIRQYTGRNTKARTTWSDTKKKRRKNRRGRCWQWLLLPRHPRVLLCLQYHHPRPPAEEDMEAASTTFKRPHSPKGEAYPPIRLLSVTLPPTPQEPCSVQTTEMKH